MRGERGEAKSSKGTYDDNSHPHPKLLSMAVLACEVVQHDIVALWDDFVSKKQLGDQILDSRARGMRSPNCASAALDIRALDIPRYGGIIERHTL